MNSYGLTYCTINIWPGLYFPKGLLIDSLIPETHSLLGRNMWACRGDSSMDVCVLSNCGWLKENLASNKDLGENLKIYTLDWVCQHPDGSTVLPWWGCLPLLPHSTLTWQILQNYRLYIQHCGREHMKCIYLYKHQIDFFWLTITNISEVLERVTILWRHQHAKSSMQKTLNLSLVLQNRRIIRQHNCQTHNLGSQHCETWAQTTTTLHLTGHSAIMSTVAWH